MDTDPHHLARAVAMLNRRLRQERQSALTPTQLSLLGTIYVLGRTTPGTIAARERVQPPSITRTLAWLVDAGLVVREPDPTDGRQVIVSLSAAGESALAAERERRDQWLALEVEKLTARERQVLGEAAAIMEKLSDS